MPSTIRLGVVMDPIAGINPAKDSSLAMMLEAQRRGMQLIYLEQNDLRIRNGEALASARAVRVHDSRERWFELGDREEMRLCALDVILMRKDPPVDLEYLYATHLLDLAERAGALVVDRPRALRDANEKLFAQWFPQCCPPTLVSSDMARLRGFLGEPLRASYASALSSWRSSTKNLKQDCRIDAAGTARSAPAIP